MLGCEDDGLVGSMWGSMVGGDVGGNEDCFIDLARVMHAVEA